MNILMVGDIVGSAGRAVFARVVKRYRAENNLDFVVVNAENSAGGRGITAKIVKELLAAGADVITLGDHTWDQKELQQFILTESRLLRPANFAPGCPGSGLVTVPSAWGDVTVVNLVGRVFMKPYDCPFRKVDQLLKETNGLGNVVLVDMHAEATSEKIAMGRYLNGRVSAIVGTHTHVQTSDEEVLSDGTAYITDLGMTGAKDSIIGRDVDAIMSTFITGMPAKFSLAKEKVMLEGVMIDVDRNTGKANSIVRIREK